MIALARFHDSTTLRPSPMRSQSATPGVGRIRVCPQRAPGGDLTGYWHH